MKQRPDASLSLNLGITEEEAWELRFVLVDAITKHAEAFLGYSAMDVGRFAGTPQTRSRFTIISRLLEVLDAQLDAQRE